jgi:hypothetical protein
MRTATMVTNLLASVVLAVACVYVQVVMTEVLSLAGRLGLGFAGVCCLIGHLVVCLRSRLVEKESTAW